MFQFLFWFWTTLLWCNLYSWIFFIIFKIEPVNCSLRSELFYDSTQPLKFEREIPIMIYSIKLCLTFWTKFFLLIHFIQSKRFFVFYLTIFTYHISIFTYQICLIVEMIQNLQMNYSDIEYLEPINLHDLLWTSYRNKRKFRWFQTKPFT